MRTVWYATVGGGFYVQEYAQYYPEPTAFTVSGCTASGSITGGTIVGTIAGYIYNNSTVDETNDGSGVTIDGFAGDSVGGDATTHPLAGLH